MSGFQFAKLDDVLVNMIVSYNAVAIFLGIAMPYFFSVPSLQAVNVGAFKIIYEIQRQFNIPGAYGRNNST